MITEAVANWFLGIVVTVIGWFPEMTPDLEAAVGGFDGQFQSIMDMISKLSPLLPFEQIGASVWILGGFGAVALALQGTRIVGSFLTVGGGGV